MNQISIAGAAPLDSAELEEALSPFGPSSSIPERSSDTFHELGTTVIVLAFLPSAILAIGAWLNKPRSHRSVKLDVEVTRPDGTRIRRSLSSASAEAGAPDPEFTKALSELSGLAHGDVVAAIRSQGTPD